MPLQTRKVFQEGRKTCIRGRRNRKAFSVFDEQIVFPISVLFYSSVKHICCHIAQQEGIF